MEKKAKKEKRKKAKKRKGGRETKSRNIRERKKTRAVNRAQEDLCLFCLPEAHPICPNQHLKLKA
jgi:hypothetical protein